VHRDFEIKNMSLKKVYVAEQLLTPGVYDAVIVSAEEGTTAIQKKDYVRLVWKIPEHNIDIEEMYWQNNQRSMFALTNVYTTVVGQDESEDIDLGKLIGSKKKVEIYSKRPRNEDGLKNAIRKVFP
jgi:hypothetical protein